jgi:hypothetical protein
VALQDPYCAWDIKTNSCQAYRPGQKEQLQNVNIGYHPQCPVPIEPTTTVRIWFFIKSFVKLALFVSCYKDNFLKLDTQYSSNVRLS